MTADEFSQVARAVSVHVGVRADEVRDTFTRAFQVSAAHDLRAGDLVYLSEEGTAAYYPPAPMRRVVMRREPVGYWRCHYCGGLVHNDKVKCPNCAGERR